ncbi:zinc finger, CCHC-type containing protein, partial [Tanacetum coccineum]
LEGYSDARWISNTEDNSSTSGWVFLLGGGAIFWACSTTEYEFMALATAGKEVEWLKNLLFEIPLWVKPIAPISIRSDSAPTLAKAYNQMYNGKSRHLGVRHNIIRELITNGVVSLGITEDSSKTVKLMTKLTQKGVKFDWGDKQEAAFQLLKQKLCSAPILALPEGSKDFVVYLRWPTR